MVLRRTTLYTQIIITAIYISFVFYVLRIDVID